MKRVLVVLAVLAVAAACGGAASSVADRSSTTGGTAFAPLPAGGQPAKAGAQPGGTAGGTAGPATAGTVPVLQGPPVIRQAQLGITVGNGSFDSKLTQVRTLVESEGGYIAGTDAQAAPGTGAGDSQPGDIRTGVVNFMVPAANFDATIDALARVGTLQSEHISGTDVSAQYVDLNARLANAQAQRDAMLALLARAQNISDIIQIQNQIGQITGEIEQLKGQIKYLDQNTSYSTVTVSLTEAGAPVRTQPADSWGFATALSAAAHNFVTTVNYVITGLGALGPVLVLLGAAYLVWRRRGSPQPRHAGS